MCTFALIAERRLSRNPATVRRGMESSCAGRTVKVGSMPVAGQEMLRPP